MGRGGRKKKSEVGREGGKGDGEEGRGMERREGGWRGVEEDVGVGRGKERRGEVQEGGRRNKFKE